MRAKAVVTMVSRLTVFRNRTLAMKSSTKPAAVHRVVAVVPAVGPLAVQVVRVRVKQAVLLARPQRVRAQPSAAVEVPRVLAVR